MLVDFSSFCASFCRCASSFSARSAFSDLSALSDLSPVLSLLSPVFVSESLAGRFFLACSGALFVPCGKTSRPKTNPPTPFVRERNFSGATSRERSFTATRSSTSCGWRSGSERNGDTAVRRSLELVARPASQSRTSPRPGRLAASVPAAPPPPAAVPMTAWPMAKLPLVDCETKPTAEEAPKSRSSADRPVLLALIGPLLGSLCADEASASATAASASASSSATHSAVSTFDRTSGAAGARKATFAGAAETGESLARRAPRVANIGPGRS
mmetsp:Transcript_88862/g.272158  ORF Transcript_88862/g.272158 Transcript_88862/m.272158 type:complete len:271 (-) Transcript_88862:42-854(-)